MEVKTPIFFGDVIVFGKYGIKREWWLPFIFLRKRAGGFVIYGEWGQSRDDVPAGLRAAGRRVKTKDQGIATLPCSYTMPRTGHSCTIRPQDNAEMGNAPGSWRTTPGALFSCFWRERRPGTAAKEQLAPKWKRSLTPTNEGVFQKPSRFL